MSERPYWFEEVPEEEKYWFLAPRGKSPRKVGEEEASGFPPGLIDELRDTADQVTSRSAFSQSPEERKKAKESKEAQDRAGYGLAALLPPWLAEIQPRREVRTEQEFVSAPVFFTTYDRAEEERSSQVAREPEGYLELLEQHEESVVNEAVSNTPPLKVLWIDRENLLDKLEDSEFLCVMLDSVLKTRQDFMAELRRGNE